MDQGTRFQIFTVHDTELEEWYEAGWSYDGPSERPGYSIISWRGDRAPVAPLSALACDDEQVHLVRAVAALEGRAVA
ncbi:hypothetical protein ACSVBT_06970 [Afipia sp. TerB]